MPPFTEETARQKVKAAQDAWNTRDPEKVSLAYTEDSKWRNRDEFFESREEIVAFLKRKWERERDYRLEKNLWCFTENRIAVRFGYESRDAEGQWWRSHPYDPDCNAFPFCGCGWFCIGSLRSGRTVATPERPARH